MLIKRKNQTECFSEVIRLTEEIKKATNEYEIKRLKRLRRMVLRGAK